MTSTTPCRVYAGIRPIDVFQMSDTDLSSGANAMREKLKNNGFLLLRELLPPSTVASARNAIINKMTCRPKRRRLSRDSALLAEGESCLCESSSSQVCVDDDDNMYPCTVCGATPSLLSRTDITRLPDVCAALEHPALFDVAATLLVDDGDDGYDEFVWTYERKWLRAVAPSLYTGLHSDFVYFPNSPYQLTIWIPLGNIPPQHGSMIVCKSSHVRSCNFHSILRPDDCVTCYLINEREAYIRRVLSMPPAARDGAGSDWYRKGDFMDLIDNCPALLKHQLEALLMTADMRMGDVLVLHSRVLHMTSRNDDDRGRLRLSCDTRWNGQNSTPDAKLGRITASPFLPHS